MTHWVQELFMFGLQLNHWNSERSLYFDNWRYAIMLTNVMMGFGFTISTQTCKKISNCLYPNILTHISIFKKAFSQDLGKKT